MNGLIYNVVIEGFTALLEPGVPQTWRVNHKLGLYKYVYQNIYLQLLCNNNFTLFVYLAKAQYCHVEKIQQHDCLGKPVDSRINLATASLNLSDGIRQSTSWWANFYAIKYLFLNVRTEKLSVTSILSTVHYKPWSVNFTLQHR